jgi:hypothetical protein
VSFDETSSTIREARYAIEGFKALSGITELSTVDCPLEALSLLIGECFDGLRTCRVEVSTSSHLRQLDTMLYKSRSLEALELVCGGRGSGSMYSLYLSNLIHVPRLRRLSITTNDLSSGFLRFVNNFQDTLAEFRFQLLTEDEVTPTNKNLEFSSDMVFPHLTLFSFLAPNREFPPMRDTLLSLLPLNMPRLTTLELDERALGESRMTLVL